MTERMKVSTAQPGAPALSEYIIIEKRPHGISAWFCELPTVLFLDYCNQGSSVAGPLSFVLEDVQKRCAEWHDSVSTDEQAIDEFAEAIEAAEMNSTNYEDSTTTY